MRSGHAVLSWRARRAPPPRRRSRRPGRAAPPAARYRRGRRRACGPRPCPCAAPSATMVDELVEQIVHQALQYCAPLGRQRLGEARLVLQRAGDERVGGDAELAEQAGDLAGLQDHADRAGERRVAGEDAGGGQRDHVAGRGGGAAHDGDDRLAWPTCISASCRLSPPATAPPGLSIETITAGHGAVAGQAAHRSVSFAVVVDDAGDVDPRDVRAGAAVMPGTASDARARRHDGERRPATRQKFRRRLRRRLSRMRSVSEPRRLDASLLGLLVAAADGGAQDVAQRGAAVGGAELGSPACPLPSRGP